MTIAEIESTIKILSVRHKNLDESLLVTLLVSGGWESKMIEDALFIYRSSYKKNEIPDTIKSSDFSVKKTADISSSDLVYFDDEGKEVSQIDPSFYEEVTVERPVLEKVYGTEISKTPQDEGLLSVSENTNFDSNQNIEHQNDVNNIFVPDIADSKIEAIPEPNEKEISSLIVQKEENFFKRKESAPPDNLPLKPFDSAPHIWPFSKYKEIFEKDVDRISHQEEVGQNNIIKEQEVVNEIPKNEALKNEPIKSDHLQTLEKEKKLEKEDLSLLFIVILTILVISLLIIYMYSNGRF